MASALICVALVLSFAGRFTYIGDSLAVFRLPLAFLAGLLSAVLLARGLRGYMRGVLAVAVGAGLVTASHYWPLNAAVPGQYTLYQKNVLYLPGPVEAIAADISATAPDFLTLQELSLIKQDILNRVSDRLPSQHRCRVHQYGGEAVASRFPKIEGSGRCAYGLAAMQVETPAGPVWVVSIHLRWPYPGSGGADARRLAGVLAELDGPIVMGGDFNMVAWAYSVQLMADAGRVVRAGPIVTSYNLFGLLPLPIDQVFAPGGGQAQKRPKAGSDHYGVVARISL